MARRFMGDSGKRIAREAREVAYQRYLDGKAELPGNLQRCPAVSTGGLAEDGSQMVRRGTRCGLEAGHEGDHSVLIPTGYPWAPVVNSGLDKQTSKTYHQGMGIWIERLTCDHCKGEVGPVTVTVLPASCPLCGAPLLALCQYRLGEAGSKERAGWQQFPPFPETVKIGG